MSSGSSSGMTSRSSFVRGPVYLLCEGKMIHISEPLQIVLYIDITHKSLEKSKFTLLLFFRRLGPAYKIIIKEDKLRNIARDQGS